jgi:hypothetical protein
MAYVKTGKRRGKPVNPHEDDIFALAQQGYSLRSIGNAIGLSAERVRKILANRGVKSAFAYGVGSYVFKPVPADWFEQERREAGIEQDEENTLGEMRYE